MELRKHFQLSEGNKDPISLRNVSVYLKSTRPTDTQKGTQHLLIIREREIKTTTKYHLTAQETIEMLYRKVAQSTTIVKNLLKVLKHRVLRRVQRKRVS